MARFLQPSIVRLFVSLCVSVFLALTAQAQITNVTDSTSTPIPGAGHDYIKMLNETVNPANGSVSIRIQAPTPRGRGLSLPFAFAYDSNAGVHISTDGSGNLYWASNPAYLSAEGWSYSVPMVGLVWVQESVSGHGGKCLYFNDYVFQDETGGRHALSMALVGAPTVCQYAVPVPQQVLNGGDDYYRAAIAGLGSPLNIADADGTVYSFPSGGAHDDLNSHYSSLVSSIEDRNGNVITVTDLGTQHKGAFTVADTLGRTVMSASGFGSNGDTVSISGLGGSYVVGWATIATGPPVLVGSKLLSNGNGLCSTSFPNINGGGVSEINQITLPNNQSYVFSYDSSYGLLKQISYPTGGYIKYDWGLSSLSEFDSVEDTNGGQHSCPWHHDTPAVAHRYVSFDGVNVALQQDFSYQTNWSSNTSSWATKITTIKTTDKLSGLVYTEIYTYSPIPAPIQPNDIASYAPQIPVELSIVTKDSGNNTLRTVSKIWVDQYELKSQTTTLDDQKTTSQTTYTYGPGAQVTERDDYDYGSGSPGPLLRKVKTSYQSFVKTAIFPSTTSIFGLCAGI